MQKVKLLSCRFVAFLVRAKSSTYGFSVEILLKTEDLKLKT